MIQISATLKNQTSANSKNLLKAVCNFSYIIKCQFNNVEAYYKRGIAHLALGFKKQAIRDLSQTIKLSPMYAEAYYARAIVYYECNNYSATFYDLSAAIFHDPEYADAYYNRGLIYYKLQHKNKAFTDWQKAVKLYKQQGKMKKYHRAIDLFKKYQ